MKIATWNLERPTQESSRFKQIETELKRVNADIFILTESNDCFNFEGYSSFHSSILPEPFYKPSERRISIYTKYEIVGEIETFRDNTSICKILETPFGKIAFYGTIIGIYGNRRKDFNQDLDSQMRDIEKISSSINVCFAGDLNMTISDNYYFTKHGRSVLIKKIEDNFLLNLTASIPQNIDHIVISENIVITRNIKIETWNVDKKLSDHIGIVVTIE